MKTLIFLTLGLIFALGLAAQDPQVLPGEPSAAPPPAPSQGELKEPPPPAAMEVPSSERIQSETPGVSSGDAAEPTADAPSSPAPPAGAQETPLPPGTESFVYDPAGKRDPFQPEPDKETPLPEGTQVQGRRLPTPAPLPQREREPLESFDLFQLKVSAIIWDTKNPRAMLLDPVGNTHVVKLKTRIGKNNGFVVAIREGEVVVVEYNAELDQWVKSFKVLELR